MARMPEQSRRPAVAPKSANPLLAGPILPTLLRLTLPNLAAMLVTALVAIAETAYVGILGTTQLAAIALVFPMVMLMQMLSAGAMGGGVSSAISRALGAGDEARAEALALHATVIGVVAGRDVLGAVRRLRARHLPGARRPWRRARARAHLRQRGARGAGADLAPQYAGLHRARHRQHARALADAARGSDAADRARRRAGARARTDPALRPRRRGLGPGDRLRRRRAVPAVVPAVRPGARDAQVQRHRPDPRDVLRHPEGRRARRLLAAADRC